MIPVTRPDKPKELTEELQKELTEKFKITGERVWNVPFLTKALLDMSHSKCVYSECRLQEEGKHMEVEHYLPKEKYKDKVMEWTNLLPANKKCNGVKGDHDTLAEPIINPCVDIPKEHLIFKYYRFYHKTEKGNITIKVTAINDREHFVKKRIEIGDKVLEEAARLNEWFEELVSGAAHTTRQVGNRITQLIAIMIEAKPEVEYSSTVATVLIHCPHYKRIKEILESRKEWTDELQKLHDGMAEIAFDTE